jgi:hypothetical protein
MGPAFDGEGMHLIPRNAYWLAARAAVISAGPAVREPIA